MRRLPSRRMVLIGGILAACGAKARAPSSVATLDALRSVGRADLASGAEIVVDAAGVGGRLRWDPRSVAADDGSITFALADRGPGRWVRVTNGTIDVRWFGAAPSASAAANSRAFAAASAAINRAGGGTLLVPPGIYRVGYQPARHPVDIIRIEGCRRPVVLSGKRATLKAADKLKFGAFHPRTGRRHDPAKLPLYDPAYRIDAYQMILVKDCSGGVLIEGFELDGNLVNYDLGGQWGDTGRQVTADGIWLENNRGPVTITGVNSHHHGRDGIVVAHFNLPPTGPRYPVTLTDIVCDSNARQGLSWIGGNSLIATRCHFTRTGRARFASGPSAGVDVEATVSVCRNGRFVDCTFVDNVGAGFVADSGDTADVLLQRCTFIGTTFYSAWPRKPGIVFEKCEFVGSIVQTYGSPDPSRAAKFLSCRFRSDSRRSPTGKVFGEFLADLGAGAANVLMSDCSFDAMSPGTALPYTPSDVRYHNCRFRQAGTKQSYPRGTFTGVNEIKSAGPVELAGSRFLGRVVLNGRVLS